MKSALPYTMSRRAAAVVATPPVDPPRTQAPRILVAEDHPVNRAIIGCQLQHLGYVPTLVEDGGQALDALARDRYDLLLTDCRMPVLDGLALTRAIRNGDAGSNPRLPIVALSGAASQTSHEACIAAGMDGYLPKPARIAVLQCELARHLTADARAEDGPRARAGENRRRTRRLVDVFGSASRAQRVLQPLLDTCRIDLEALDAALRSGDRLRQRDLLHRVSGALALVGAEPRAERAPSRAPRDPVQHRDLLARRVDALRRLLARLHAHDPSQNPA